MFIVILLTLFGDGKAGRNDSLPIGSAGTLNARTEQMQYRLGLHKIFSIWKYRSPVLFDSASALQR